MWWIDWESCGGNTCHILLSSYAFPAIIIWFMHLYIERTYRWNYVWWSHHRCLGQTDVQLLSLCPHEWSALCRSGIGSRVCQSQPCRAWLWRIHNICGRQVATRCDEDIMAFTFHVCISLGLSMSICHIFLSIHVCSGCMSLWIYFMSLYLFIYQRVICTWVFKTFSPSLSTLPSFLVF